MSLIMQILGEEGCQELNRILEGEYGNSTAKKQDIVSNLIKTYFGGVEVGSGTNRIVFRFDFNPTIVFKIAVDNQGIEDNIREHKLSAELEGYATRTYETNGLVAVAERVRTMKYADMQANMQHVASILNIISKKYLLDDIGFESFKNWGFRPDGSIVVLDYAYLHPNEGINFKCPDCYATVGYDSTFKNFICPECEITHKIGDFKKQALRDSYGVPNILEPIFNTNFVQTLPYINDNEGEPDLSMLNLQPTKF